MAEALDCLLNDQMTNRKSPDELDFGLSEDIMLGSDFVDDISTDVTPEETYQAVVVSEERKSLFQQVIRQCRKGGEKQVYLSFWDYAGQSTYYSTHQAFLSPNAVYLLVFDVSKSVDTNLKDSLNFQIGGSPMCTVRGIN